MNTKAGRFFGLATCIPWPILSVTSFVFPSSCAFNRIKDWPCVLSPSSLSDEIDQFETDNDISSETPPFYNADRNSEALKVPSIRTILHFALPATAIYLCSPLLSMIDTSTVGLLAGTNQQAALNPAVSLTEYSGRLISFLYTGTTSLMAANRGDRESSKGFLIGALQLSLLVGLALGGVLFVFTKPLLRAMIGNELINSNVFEAAVRYVRIRALGMPAAALMGCAQAACLGLQDVRSPLRIISVAAIINLMVDIVLVGSPNRWIGGAAGASWATTIAQYAAAGLFLKWLWNKEAISSNDARGPWDLFTNKIVSKGTRQKRVLVSSSLMSTRGFLANDPFPRTLTKLPSESIMKGYQPFILPVTMTQIGRCAVYVAMGYTVSSSFGTTSMAAQQIVCSVFYALIPIADSLSLTAQSFLPSIIQQESSQRRSVSMRRTIFNLAKTAGIFGVGLASLVATMPITIRLFTTDPAVSALVFSVVPILFAVFFFHGFFCASEGILLGQKDLTFLGRMYAAYFLVVPYLMIRVKNEATAGKVVPLRSVWNVFLGYQAFRISAWVLRVIWLQVRLENEAQSFPEIGVDV